TGLSICNIQAGFDGGTLPTGWSLLQVRGGPGLINNRLEGRPTDSGARVGAIAGVGSAREVVIEYDALNAATGSGMDHGVSLQTSSGFFWFYDQNVSAPQVTLFSRAGVSGLWPNAGNSPTFASTPVPV